MSLELELERLLVGDWLALLIASHQEMENGNFPKADYLLQSRLDIARADPNLDYTLLALLTCSLGTSNLSQRRWRAAERSFVECVRYSIVASGLSHPKTALARVMLAQALIEQGRYLAAKHELIIAMSIFTATRSTEEQGPLGTALDLVFRLVRAGAW